MKVSSSWVTCSAFSNEKAGLGVTNKALETSYERKAIHIKVLGPGCKKCHETDKIVREAVAEAGSDATVEYITDIAEIAKHGIFSTPAVIVDGQVKAVGKVPSKTDVRTWMGK